MPEQTTRYKLQNKLVSFVMYSIQSMRGTRNIDKFTVFRLGIVHITLGGGVLKI
jgi:hypothetical protein